MSLPKIDGTIDPAQVHDSPRWFLPIPQDTRIKAFEQDFVVWNYTVSPEYASDGTLMTLPVGIRYGGAGTSTFSTPHARYPDFYLVEEKNHERVRGQCYKFTRVYSQIPKMREEWQSYSWQVPGISATGSTYPYVTVTSMTNSSTTTTVNCDAAHHMSTGDFADVQFNVIDSLGNQTTRHRTMAVTVTGGSSFTVSKITDISPPMAGSMQTRKVDMGRDAETQVVNCRIVYDYFMPGVTAGISKPSDIPDIEALWILDNTGRRTHTLSGNTTPNTTDYLALVAAGTQIVIERSTLSRWRGNIWERVTRYVRAI